MNFIIEEKNWLRCIFWFLNYVVDFNLINDNFLGFLF